MDEKTADRIIELFEIWEIPELVGGAALFQKHQTMREEDTASEELLNHLNVSGEAPENSLYLEHRINEFESLLKGSIEEYPFIYDFYQKKKSEFCGKGYSSLVKKIQKDRLRAILYDSRERNISTLRLIEKRFATVYYDILGISNPEEKQLQTPDTDGQIMRELYLIASHCSKYYQDYLVHIAIGALPDQVKREYEETERIMITAQEKYPYIYQYYTLKNRDYFTFHSLMPRTLELEKAVDKILVECTEARVKKLQLIDQEINRILTSTDKKQEVTSELPSMRKADEIKNNEPVASSTQVGMIPEFATLVNLKPKEIFIHLNWNNQGKELTITVRDINVTGGFELLDLYKTKDCIEVPRMGIYDLFIDITYLYSKNKICIEEVVEKYVSQKGDTLKKTVKYLSELNSIFRSKFPLGNKMKAFKKPQGQLPEAIIAITVTLLRDPDNDKFDEIKQARIKNGYADYTKAVEDIRKQRATNQRNNLLKK